jgi:hypothetical protein
MPNYEDYLEHFFEKAETSIQEGKGNQLSDNLLNLNELIHELVIKEQVSEGQFRSDYKFCKRRYVRLYKQILENGADEDLRESVLKSISAEASSASESNDLVAYQQLLNALKKCYKKSFPKPGFDDATEEIFERYEAQRITATQIFQDADNVERLAESKEIVETLLESYRDLWKFAIEYECEDSIKRLHHNLNNIRGFERATYTRTGIPEDEYNHDLQQKKQELADSFRKRIEIQKFAAYSWAYKLYTANVYSDKSFIQTLYQDYAEQNFSFIKDLSNIYFHIKSKSKPNVDLYWEHWETTRQLENAIGSSFASMGVNTWLTKVYLALSLHLFDQDTQDRFQDSTPEELPIPTGREHRIELGQLTEPLQEFENDYPLDFLLDDDVDLDERITNLSEIIEEAHSHAEKQRLMWVRNQPIEPEYIETVEENLNRDFDNSCILRKALKEIGLLQQKQFPPDTDGIRLGKLCLEKRMFVQEEDVAGPQTGPFGGIFESYNECALRKLTLDEYNVDSVYDLLDEIEDQVNKRDPSLILLDLGQHRMTLLDDERFTHGAELSDAHHSFLDIPVLTESTDTYTALLLLENESRGVEFVNKDGKVLDVEATPGEEAGVIDMPNKSLESIPYPEAPHDYVQIDIRIRGFIQSKELDGVLFHLNSEDSD